MTLSICHNAIIVMATVAGVGENGSALNPKRSSRSKKGAFGIVKHHHVWNEDGKECITIEAMFDNCICSLSLNLS